MVTWLPLELWRASSLPGETQTVTSLYERLQREGDASQLETLRASIEARIDELETFYVNHVDDSRAVLFEKQRFALRKLIHAYDTAADAAGGAGGGGGADTRVVRDDTRCTWEELLEWCHTSADAADLRSTSDEALERAFTDVAATNADARVSPRELRQYLVEAAKKRAATSTRRKDLTKNRAFEMRKKAAKDKLGGGAKKSPKTPKPIYAWEVRDNPEMNAAASVLPMSPAGRVVKQYEDADEPMLGITDVLEFQLRLTKEEYQHIQLRRRAMEAEARHFSRTVAGGSPDKAAGMS